LSERLFPASAGAGARGRPASQGSRARCVFFHGAGGGVGATFLASESVAMLSAGGRRVAAVDAHTSRGAMHYRLDVALGRGVFTIEDLLPVLGDLSDRMVDNVLTPCPCGAHLVLSGTGEKGVTNMTPDQVRQFTATLRDRFDHVVIDTAPSLEGASVARGCGDVLVVLVVIPELSCLGSAKRALESLDRLGTGRGDIRLVINRSLGRKDSLTLSDIESFLQMPACVVLPEETALCRRAAFEGTFVHAGGSELGRGLRAMVNRLFLH
jgi:MinD-like ATPase involved in chromosome partitioning or flagellar assembly